MSRAMDVHEILLEAHRRGQKSAIDESIRTGVPLVVMRNGKIHYEKPKYKLVRVPISSKPNKR